MAALNCPGVPQSQRGQIITLETLEVERVAAILQAYPQRVACLILDPMVWPLPDRETLGAIQALLQEAGTLLIFDEVVSGFRVAPGGAQEFWQIQADLVCYGKCIANGLPLAVLAGRQSLMAQVSDISYGLTFGLEAVSIVAAVATLSEIVERDVCSALAEKGRFLKQTYDQLCQRQGLESALVGHDCRPEIWFPAASPLPPDFCKNLLIRELSRQGVSSYGFFNLCYAHTQADLDQTVVGLERGLDILASLIQAPQSWERRRLESLGETVKDLTGQLRQSQEILSQALTEKERLTAELNAQLQQSQQSLSQWQGEATGLKTQLQQESQRLAEVRGEIEAMQTSKFWRLRGQWFRLKRKLGLPIV
jgi:hypothetical protein